MVVRYFEFKVKVAVKDRNVKVEDLADYLNDSLALDLNTEENGNPYNVGSVYFDFDNGLEIRP